MGVMEEVSKGRRYQCSKCGVLFFVGRFPLPGKDEVSSEKEQCPKCGSSELTSVPNVVTK
jgi:ribosomal protein S27AE